jgi:hypothetical protein
MERSLDEPHAGLTVTNRERDDRDRRNKHQPTACPWTLLFSAAILCLVILIGVVEPSSIGHPGLI